MWKKLLGVLPAQAMTVLGITQAVIKLLKEVLTGIVNVLYPVIPSDKFKKVVESVRSFINKADDIVEKIKAFILKLV